MKPLECGGTPKGLSEYDNTYQFANKHNEVALTETANLSNENNIIYYLIMRYYYTLPTLFYSGLKNTFMCSVLISWQLMKYLLCINLSKWFS